MMSRPIRIAAFVAVFLGAAPAAAEDARAVMEQTVDQVLAVLNDESLSHEDKLRRIEEVAECMPEYL